MSRQIATFFGCGLSPAAPGTVGSFAALLLGALLIAVGNMWTLVCGACLIFLIGLWAVDAQTRGKEDKDPGEIVIDEVAGQLFTLLPLAAGLSPFAGPTVASSMGAFLLAFVLFRLFDIFKPYPISWVDQHKTPSGVMFDDALAAIMASGVIIAMHFLIELMA